MTELFLRISHWSDPEFMALYFATFVIGFLLAKMVLPARKPIGRIAFWVGVSLCTLFFTVLDGAWLFLTVGHRHNILDGMILALFLVPAFHGAAVQRLSSARANDMWGNSKNDWIAFVPFGIFVFVFKSGQKAAAAKDAPYSAGHATLRVVRDSVLIMVGFVAYMISRVVAETIEVSPLAYSSEVEQMWAEVTSTLPPATQFELEVIGTRHLLPYDLDSQTTLIAVRAVKDHLYLTYKFTGDADDLTDFHGWTLKRDACSAEVFHSALMLGGTVHYEYTGGANHPIRAYTVAAKDCPSGMES